VEVFDGGRVAGHDDARMRARNALIVDAHGADERISPDQVLALGERKPAAIALEQERAAGARTVMAGRLHLSSVCDKRIAIAVMRPDEARHSRIVAERLTYFGDID